MSSTGFTFKAKLLIGEQVVPLLSEIAFGDSQSADGVQNGFIFKLDRQPSDPPVTVYLGDVIEFIESKLGAGDLSGQVDGSVVQGALGFNSTDFNASNQTLINIYQFSINSGGQGQNSPLFAFNLDVQGSDPTQGLIPLPSQLAQWLKIDNISLAFSATSKSST